MSDQTTGSTSNLILAAIESSFRAKRDEAIANLSVYINSPSMASYNTNVVSECCMLVQEISDAESCIRTIQALFVRKD